MIFSSTTIKFHVVSVIDFTLLPHYNNDVLSHTHSPTHAHNVPTTDVKSFSKYQNTEEAIRTLEKLASEGEVLYFNIRQFCCFVVVIVVDTVDTTGFADVVCFVVIIVVPIYVFCVAYVVVVDVADNISSIFR